MLTQGQLIEAVDYDPKSGGFMWRQRADMRPQWNGRFAGKRAGNSNTYSGIRYWEISINGRKYLGHRLAWLYVRGEWPPCGKEIDHRDRDGLNNRISNLRLGTKSQNMGNQKARAVSGFKGVRRVNKRWRAEINQTHLGYFDTPSEAHDAYMKAARERYGEFARAG